MARVDIEQYRAGARKCRNFVPIPQGPATRRPGTRFVAEVKDSRRYTRTFSFQYSVDEAYVVEAGNLYFRFYAKGGQVVSGGAPVEVVTPWSTGDLDELQVTQSADTMYIVHPDYPPQKLVRTTATSFTLSAVDFSKGRAPFRAYNLDPTNYPTLSGTWPNITITMVKDTFVAGDVGRIFYIRNVAAKAAWYMQITSVTNAKVAVTTGVYQWNATSPGGTTGDRWAMSLFSTGNGCRAVAFHEGRLWYGGFKLEPSMIWGSVSDDFDNFEFQSPDPTTATSANADKAIQRVLPASSGSTVSAVLWMAGIADRLVIGGSGSEFVIQSDQDNILTPTAAAVKRQTARGSAPLAPAVIDNSLFFLQRGARHIRQFTFETVQQAYNSLDISILSLHLLREGVGIRSLVYQQDPFSVLWALRLDGKLVGWTIDRDQKVVAASLHSLGGSDPVEEPVVESIAVIPGQFTVPAETVLTGAIGSITSSITNPGAEAGDLTGWTAAGTWAAAASSGSLVPQAGSYLFTSSDSALSTLVGDLIDLSAVAGINLALIDNGQTVLDVSQWIAMAGNYGHMDVIIEALAASGVVLGTIYQASVNNPLPDGTFRPAVSAAWEQVTAASRPVPPLARSLRVTYVANPVGTPAAEVEGGQCFDSLTLTIAQVDNEDDTRFQEAEDQLWMTVRRRVNGATVRYVEVLSPAFQPALEDTATAAERTAPLYTYPGSDCALSYDVPISIGHIVTGAATTVYTTTAHGLVGGQGVRFQGLSGTVASALDGRRAVVVSATATSFTVDVDTSGLAFAYDGGNAVCRGEVSEIAGISHLEGAAVAVLADGEVIEGLTVRGGSITLPTPASVVVVGLGFDAYVETMPIFGVGRRGADQNLPIGLTQILVRLHNTVGAEIGKGSPVSKWQALPTRSTSDILDMPPLLFSGDRPLTPEGSWKTKWPTISIRQNKPLPCTLLGVFADAEAAED